MARVVQVTTVPESFRATRGQAAYLRAAGLEVHAVATPGDELQAVGRREGIPVHGVAMTRSITPGRDLVSTWRLWRLLRRLRPDIVHAHTPKAGLLSMLAARLAGVPVRIYHVRGLRLATARGWRRRLLKGCEWLACRLASDVLCVSRSLREVAVAEGLVPRGKIHVLANGGHGIDAAVRLNPDRLPPDTRRATRARYGIPADALVLGFVGRLVRDKGIAELARAWQGLREKFPTAHLLLIGPREANDPVPPEIFNQLEADPRVHLTGTIWETPPLYAAMDVVCLPSYREGLPKVPLEAAALERPVVATRIPGCIDAVEEHVTGLLVPPRESGLLAFAVRSYFDDAELRRRHGAAGRARVLRDFDCETVRAALLRHYARLLGLCGRPLDLPDGATADDQHAARKAA